MEITFKNIKNDIENSFDKIYKQFILDLPRMKLYLDNYLCKNSHTYVKEYLESHLDNNSTKMAIYLMTQTFLANFFIKEYKKRISSEEHLLDNANYIVYIDTCSKIINISKDFKVIYFLDNESEYIVDYCTLNIYLKLKNMTMFYYWDYEFK